MTAKKAAAKQPAKKTARKTAARKTAPRKTAARKTPARKVAAKKTTARARKTAPQKSAAAAPSLEPGTVRVRVLRNATGLPVMKRRGTTEAIVPASPQLAALARMGMVEVLDGDLPDDVDSNVAEHAVTARADGDTVTIVMLRPVVGFPDVGQAVTLIQTPQVDALIADGMAVIAPAGMPIIPSMPTSILWQPYTVYPAGWEVFNPGGQWVQATTGHVSGPSYDATKWTVLNDVGNGTVVTKPGIISTGVLASDLGGQMVWRPFTAYVAGQIVVTPTGRLQAALSSFTSGSSFNPANWADAYTGAYVGLTQNVDPTGATDSTSGLRSAVATAETPTGQPVVLGPGNYTIASTDSDGIFVALTAGITIKPLIPGTVTIKIADSVTRWWSIFGAKSSGVDLTDFNVDGIIFDCNSSHNAWTPSTIGDRTSGYPRYVVSAYRGDRLKFNNCIVKNFDGSNAVAFNTESTGGHDAEASYNKFLNIGSTCYHDHSLIFLNAKGVRCVGNHGIGITPPAGAASNAICFAELHGSDIYAAHNTSEYFSVGINICTADATHNLNGSSTYTVHDNHFLHCATGEQVWPYQDMTGVDVHDNEITVDIDFWANGLPLGDGSGGVTSFRHSPLVRVPTMPGSIACKFHHDRWTYLPFTTTPASIDNAVQFVSNSTPDAADSIEITSISASNLPAAFMRYAGYLSAKRLHVDADIRNLGIAKLGSGLQSMVYVAQGGAINDFSLTGTVADDQTVATCQQLLQVDNVDTPAPTMPGAALLDMRYWAADGTTPSIFSGIHIPARLLTATTLTELGLRRVLYGPPNGLEAFIYRADPSVTGGVYLARWQQNVTGNPDFFSAHTTRGVEARGNPILVPRGAYTAGAVYWRGDVTTFNGITWFYGGTTPYTAPATFDPTQWTRLSGGKTFGIVATTPPFVAAGVITIGNANDCRYMRVLDEGDISKIRLHVSASSGNIAVAAYRNSGAGRSAVPGTQLATSGAIACPAVGDVDVSLGSTVHVYEGDWLAISCDNTAATFYGLSGGGSGSLYAGLVYAQSSAHPCPATPASLSPQNSRMVNLGGV